MFKLEQLYKAIGATVMVGALSLTACNAANDTTKNAAETTSQDASRTYTDGKKVIDGGVTYPLSESKSGPYYINTQKQKDFTFGRKPTENEIKAWNIDVMYYGEGLPEGSGSVEDGDSLFEEQCAMCHGDFGAGGKGYPTISGTGSTASLKNQRINGHEEGPERAIGSYWPYASTLFWYTKSAMPFPHPKSLSVDETYALVAYMLSVNHIKIDGEELEDEYVLNKEKFLKIKMPNIDGFEPEIRGKDGIENVRTYFNDPSNYGNGKRCMKDCIDKVNVVRIKMVMENFEPPLSVERSLPKEDASAVVAVSPGKKTYDASCAVCHATDAMGAPALGDKKAWAAVLEKGIDKVYHNATAGINAMPPKGGNMDLTDAQLKEVVDYMIGASK